MLLKRFVSDITVIDSIDERFRIRHFSKQTRQFSAKTLFQTSQARSKAEYCE